MYDRPRVIPCLLIQNGNLVKTIRFSKSNYLGDPMNAVKIFNEKGVDELCLLDIAATRKGRPPDFESLKKIASEAFMPLSYGGGIRSLEDVRQLFYIGFEKIILNTSLVMNENLVREAVRFAGSQSIVASIDAKKNLFGRCHCCIRGGTKKINVTPAELAQHAEELGAGEILLNNIDRDGMMRGYDNNLVLSVTSQISIPLIACGGAGKIMDLKEVLLKGKADAAAAGSMFVYYGEQKAVLINVPDEQELIDAGIYKVHKGRPHKY